MRMTPVAVLLACIAAALGLAACGGGDSEPEASPPTTAPQDDTTATDAAPTTTAESSGAAAGGGTTKPGTALQVGETAHVKRKPLNAPVNSKATFALDAAVLKIEKGSLDDFENVDLDEDQKKSTPFYVTVRVSNPAGSKLPADDDPTLGFDGIDDRGQRQGRVIFFGTFERCDYADVPKPFGKGKSYESCLVFLIPGGGSIEEVHWTGSDEYFSEPITWK